MPNLFREFTKTYEQFTERFPNHQLTEEIRSRIRLKKLPSDEWLKSRTKKMKNLMVPSWLRSG